MNVFFVVFCTIPAILENEKLNKGFHNELFFFVKGVNICTNISHQNFMTIKILKSIFVKNGVKIFTKIQQIYDIFFFLQKCEISQDFLLFNYPVIEDFVDAET